MVTAIETRERQLRNSDATRERILKSLGRMMVRDGLSAVGVNALARESACDKVLIYRYFGDLDGVYEAFAAHADFWWTRDELLQGLDPKRTSFGEAMKHILRRHAHAIRSRPVTLAVLAAEPIERTPLVIALETIRERRSLALAQWIGENYRVPAGVDFAAISMLLAVSINCLAVRARKIRVMSGVAIRTDADWDRLLAAIDCLINGVLRPA